MSGEAGDASGPHPGLPASAVPFAAPRPVAETAAPPSEALRLHRALCVTRAAQLVLTSLADEGRIRHAPQWADHREAGSVGTAWGIRPGTVGEGDIFAPAFRAAGALERFGVGLDDFFAAHVEGRGGASRASETELHLVDPARGLWAPLAPVGILVEVVSGMALGFRLRAEPRVGVVLDDAGAPASGSWHEGLVFAAARRCPLVLVVEMDLSASPPSARPARLASFTEVAAGYGVTAESVDGGDVLAVARSVSAAADRARSGGGVQVVEVRYEGVDPIDRLEKELVAEGLADESRLAVLREDAQAACWASAKAALARPDGELSDALRPVFTNSDPVSRPLWAEPGTPSAA